MACLVCVCLFDFPKLIITEPCWSTKLKLIPSSKFAASGDIKLEMPDQRQFPCWTFKKTFLGFEFETQSHLLKRVIFIFLL